MTYYICSSGTFEIDSKSHFVMLMINTDADKVSRLINETTQSQNIDSTYCELIYKLYPRLGICKDLFSNFYIFDHIPYNEYKQYFIFPENSIEIVRKKNKKFVWNQLI